MTQYIAKFDVPNDEKIKIAVEQAALNDSIIVVSNDDYIMEDLMDYIEECGFSSITGNPLMIMTWEEYLKYGQNHNIVLLDLQTIVAEIMKAENIIMIDCTD